MLSLVLIQAHSLMQQRPCYVLPSLAHCVQRAQGPFGLQLKWHNRAKAPENARGQKLHALRLRPCPDRCNFRSATHPQSDPEASAVRYKHRADTSPGVDICHSEQQQKLRVNQMSPYVPRSTLHGTAQHDLLQHFEGACVCQCRARAAGQIGGCRRQWPAPS